MQINNNMLNNAVKAPSPNHSGRITPEFIVMHYTAGWSARSAVNTFKNPKSKVSAHVTVDQNGVIYQHVPFNVKAWHAGPSTYEGYSNLNNHSIGIEIVNPGYLKKIQGGYLDAYGKTHSERSVGPVVKSKHTRVGSGTYYWPVYTEAALDAVEELTEALVHAYDIIDVVSHEEIDTRGWKTDPGPAFPMNRFKQAVNERSEGEDVFKVTASRLNVRSGPGTSFNVVDQIYSGKLVAQKGRRGDWMQINSDEWVHSSFLVRV